MKKIYNSYRLRIESRQLNPGWASLVSSIVGVFLALVIGGFVLRAAGSVHPIATYQEIFKEGFGTPELLHCSRMGIARRD
jgi:ABC-type uncharacterized transport system permease subunit